MKNLQSYKYTGKRIGKYFLYRKICTTSIFISVVSLPLSGPYPNIDAAENAIRIFNETAENAEADKGK